MKFRKRYYQRSFWQSAEKAEETYLFLFVFFIHCFSIVCFKKTNCA